MNFQTRPRQEKPIEAEKRGFTNFLADTFVEIFPSNPKFVKLNQEETIFFLGVDFALVLVVLDLQLDEWSTVLRELFVQESSLTILFAETFLSGFDCGEVPIVT